MRLKWQCAHLCREINFAYCNRIHGGSVVVNLMQDQNLVNTHRRWTNMYFYSSTNDLLSRIRRSVRAASNCIVASALFDAQ